MRSPTSTIALLACIVATLGFTASAGAAENYVTDFISGPDIKPCPTGALFDCDVQQTDDVTPDGLHVLFTTSAPLAPDDNDNLTDLYRWSDGALTQITARPSGDCCYESSRISDDGSRVFFTTGYAFVPEDTDGGYSDLYEWENGTVRLLSAPPGGSNLPYS